MYTLKKGFGFYNLPLPLFASFLAKPMEVFEYRYFMTGAIHAAQSLRIYYYIISSRHMT